MTQRNKQRGMSLIEVVIGTAIMGVAFGMSYLLLFSSARITQQELSLRDAQFQLYQRLDGMSNEIKEVDQALVRVEAYTDSGMTDPNQTVLVIVSARDDSGAFIRDSMGNADWQRLIVYAPYYNTGINSAELRRYEVSPIPSGFDSPTSNPVIVVADETIQLGSVIVQRLSGQSMATRVDYFRATLNTNSVRLDFAIGGDQVAGTNPVDITFEVKGRN